MLKGCQKQMIFLQTPGSTVFESAWLVLRREEAVGQEDMLAEANRIIGERIEAKGKKRQTGREKLCFLLGFLSGALFMALFYFLAVG